MLPLTDTKHCDYSIPIILAMAEVITGEMPEKVRCLRFDGIRQLLSILALYQERGYTGKILCAIAEKKSQMILAATSKTEMNQLLKPHAPHYDGAKFVPDRYMIAEEELICWSETSLKAPLNEPGFQRYLELFKQIFPEESKNLPF